GQRGVLADPAEPVRAEGALLDHAGRAGGDVRVEELDQGAVPARLFPVEGAARGGAGDHAVAAADAAVPDLDRDPLGALGAGADRADLDAGGVLAVLAGEGEQVGRRAGAVSLEPHHRQPLDAGAVVLRVRAEARHVVLLLAGDRAGAAADAAVEVDRHAPAA